METTASSTTDKVTSKAGEAVETAKEQMQEVRREAKRGLQRTTDYIQENPKQSALTAFGLGILLAQLPLRILATGLMGLLLMLLKPAALLYAGVKIAQDYRSSGNGAPPRAPSQGQPPQAQPQPRPQSQTHPNLLNK